MRRFKEDIRHQSLKAMAQNTQAVLPGTPAQQAQRMGQMLAASGWKVRLQERDIPEGRGWMVAAKSGMANKIGYISAHSAIVLICLGGLFDGDLFVRAMTWMGGKSVYTGSGFVSDVPAQHRLPASNPAFRGNLIVSEGTQSGTAILNQSDGVLLQELPFSLELKKFQVDFYPTGMPRLFASDVVLHDPATGESRPARIEVNHPASFKGITIYQSGFEDGGSRLRLRAIPVDSHADRPFSLEGKVGASVPVTHGDAQYTLEFTDLRVINVENLHAARQGADAVDVRKVDLVHTLNQRLGAADKVSVERDLRNIGPSITYRLRDAAGQAREFHNYMRPVDMGGGVPVFLLGVRASQGDNFSYLRVPVDEEGGMDGFTRLQAAVVSPELRQRAVQRYVTSASPHQRPELHAQLSESATRVLSLFAGGEKVEGRPVAGLAGISAFIEAAVPPDQHERAAEALMRLLNGVLYELNVVAREDAGLPPLPEDEATQRFMGLAMVALSDLPLYGAPYIFQLEDFQQVQASVFQVARAPGKGVVYLGCLLLIVGVFAMLYVRERRLWIWLVPGLSEVAPDTPCSHALMAMSSNRKTMDNQREFDKLRDKLLSSADGQRPTAS